MHLFLIYNFDHLKNLQIIKKNISPSKKILILVALFGSTKHQMLSGAPRNISDQMQL